MAYSKYFPLWASSVSVFLQAQSNTKVLMISTGFTSLIHILVCWILVFKFGLGCQGAALSCAVSYWINVLILSIYIKFSPAFDKTWTGFSKEGMANLGVFLVLSIPSALMVCLEYWSYEFLVLMSGLLPNPKLETSMMSVSLTTSSVIFRIPYGFGSAVSIRVSNELGAGKPQAAQLAARVVMFLAVTEGIVVSLFLVAIRHIWGYMFTNEEEVVSYLSSVMPVLALSNFIDAGCSLRYCKRMWVAKDWCFCESWCILPCWSSLFCHIDFSIALWRNGTLDGYNRWKRASSNPSLGYYHAHELGTTGHKCTK